MGLISFIIFSVMIVAAGINGGMPIPTIIGIIVICFFVFWRLSITKNSGIDKIFKPIPDDPQKSKSVVITSDGEVIRTLNDGSVKSTLNIDKKNNMGEDNIMWDFKLRKTRIILVVSIIYSILFYWFGIYEDVLDELGYWSMMSPVFIYWIAIPLFRWVMKGR
jgi:hypothetical protein